MKMKKLLSIAVAAAMSLTLLAGCGGKSSGGQAKDSFKMITIVKTESLDPYAGIYEDQTVMRMLFDALFDLNDNGEYVPSLAESYEDSGPDITVKLRQDVKFTDGEAFTADDVMFAYEKYAADPVFAARMLDIGQCEKVDDHTVIFHKAYPYAPVLAILATGFSIVSSKAYQADPEGFAANPVGAGPYKFVSQDVDGSVVLAANDDYFLGAPAIKNVTIKPPVEPSTAVISLQAKEVDLVSNVPMAQKALVESDKNLVFMEKAGWIMSTLILGGESFSDINLRKAIYYALDRQSIVDIGNEGVGKPAENLFSDLVMGDLKGKVPFGEYDLELAKEYLSKSDYKEGTVFTLVITPEFASVAQVVQSNLDEIGIKINIEQVDLNGLYAKMFTGEVQMTVTYIGNSTTPIETLIDAYDISPFDLMLHKTDEMAALFPSIQSEFDAQKRAELTVKALELIKENSDYIPLFEVVSSAAYNKDLKGVLSISAASYLFYINQMSFE